MPTILDPNASERMQTDNLSRDYGYSYPNGLDLKPGSETHERLRRMVMQRARESWEVISNRHSDWEEMDEIMTAYMTTDSKEKTLKQQDKRRPVSIQVPLTYAIKETILSHLMAVFASDILWQFEPRGPEDTVGVALAEKVIEQQAQAFKHLLTLHTAFQDGITKGIGPVAAMWDRKEGVRQQLVTDPFGFTRRESTPFVRCEGTKLKNVDPYRFLPDPNVGAHDVQEGEFVGWVWRDNVPNILSDEANSGGEMFNARYLKDVGDARSSLYPKRERQQGGYNLNGGYESDSPTTGKPVDLIYMYVNLIPGEWGLGPSDYPEKWLFLVAGDRVILRAQPLGLNHNMFPVSVCAPDYDGYTSCPIGRLEIVRGLQDVANFMYNSHVANVRKVLNDMLVVDPSMINVADLRRPGPGKIIRVRRTAFGQDIKSGIMQLNVGDATSQNIPDVNFIKSMMETSTGAVDTLQGVMRSGGERRSAQEARDTRMSALGRVEKMARLISEMFMEPLGYMIFSHTQQFMSTAQYTKVIGRFEQDIREQMMVPPTVNSVLANPIKLMSVDYDVVVKDGSLPGSEFAEQHIQLMQIAGQVGVLPLYDTRRWVESIARMMGVKNLPDMRLNVEVVPDQMIQEQAAAGNIAPVEGGGEVAA